MTRPPFAITSDSRTGGRSYGRAVTLTSPRTPRNENDPSDAVTDIRGSRSVGVRSSTGMPSRPVPRSSTTRPASSAPERMVMATSERVAPGPTCTRSDSAGAKSSWLAAIVYGPGRKFGRANAPSWPVVTCWTNASIPAPRAEIGGTGPEVTPSESPGPGAATRTCPSANARMRAPATPNPRSSRTRPSMREARSSRTLITGSSGLRRRGPAETYPFATTYKLWSSPTTPESSNRPRPSLQVRRL